MAACVFRGGETQINADERGRSDNLHANCMQIARKNYNLTLIVRGYRETEPQINADERRFVNLNLQLLPTVYSTTKSPQSAQRTQSSEVSATFALRSEKAAKPQRRTRMTRIERIFTDTSYPRLSASSAQSAFHHVCSSLKKPASGVSALIRVHLRFFKNVVFQTGLTGYGFNHVHPVILSNLMCQPHALRLNEWVKVGWSN